MCSVKITFSSLQHNWIFLNKRSSIKIWLRCLYHIRIAKDNIFKILHAFVLVNQSNENWPINECCRRPKKSRSLLYYTLKILGGKYRAVLHFSCNKKIYLLNTFRMEIELVFTVPAIPAAYVIYFLSKVKSKKETRFIDNFTINHNSNSKHRRLLRLIYPRRLISLTKIWGFSCWANLFQILTWCPHPNFSINFFNWQFPLIIIYIFHHFSRCTAIKLFNRFFYTLLIQMHSLCLIICFVCSQTLFIHQY